MKADKEEVTRLIKTARGQLDGILRMIEEDRYCVDISNQLLAVGSLIRKADRKVLEAHIRCCVKDAVDQGDAEEKVEELIRIIEKL